MPIPTYKLYTPQASFRSFSILIAAEYNGVHLEVITDPLDSVVSDVSPVGKLPTLLTPSGEAIFSSAAAARFVAGIRRDSGLLGGNGLKDQTAIDHWMDWASSELELPACVWFYPVAGYMPFHLASYEKAKMDLARGLKVLEDHLCFQRQQQQQQKQGSNKHDTTTNNDHDRDDDHYHNYYLVGSHITLADIFVISILYYPFRLVCDANYRKPYPHVTQWFTHCLEREQSFQTVLGTFQFCFQELHATHGISVNQTHKDTHIDKERER